MRRIFIAVRLLMFLFLAADAAAQSTNATLGGTVSDASGALIPGVTITATNTGTGIVTTLPPRREPAVSSSIRGSISDNQPRITRISQMGRIPFVKLA